MSHEPLVQMKYAEKKLGWTRQTIYRKCAAGLLPFRRSESGYFIFRQADVDALAEAKVLAGRLSRRH